MSSQPLMSQLHTDQHLTNLAVGWFADEAVFHAGGAAPRVMTKRQSDKYPVWTKGMLLRPQMKKRAPGTESAGTGYTLSNDTFYCDVYSLHEDIGYDDQDSADSIFNLEDNAAKLLALQALYAMELEFKATFMAGSLWTNDYDGVSGSPSTNQFKQWEASGNTVIADHRVMQRAIEKLTNLRATDLFYGAKTFDDICDDSAVVARYQYTQGGAITEQMIAALFGVKRVSVLRAAYESAVEGASSSMAYVFGNTALMCHINQTPSPDPKTPSALYNFVWQRSRAMPNDKGLYVSRIDIPTKRVTRLEGEMAFDMKLVAADCGFFVDSAVGT